MHNFKSRTIKFKSEKFPFLCSYICNPKKQFLKKLKKKIYAVSKRTGDRFGFDLPYFVENGFWVIFAQVVNMVCAFALSIVYARYLSKQTFGEYQLLIAVVGILAIISYTGLNTSVIRSVAQGYDYSYIKAVKFSFKKSLWAIPLFALISAWFYFKKSTDLAIALTMAGLLFSFIYGHTKWAAYWKGKEKFKRVVKWQIIQNISLNGILIAMVVFFSQRLLVIAGSYLIVNAGFATYWHFRTKKSVSIQKVDKDCIPYGKYMTKIGLLANLILYFDKIIIGFFDIELLAVYAIALKLFDIIKQMLKSFFSISAPKFAKQSVSIGFGKIAFLLVIGLVSTILLYMVSEPVIIYFYTGDYKESVVLFKKLILVLPLVFVSPLFANKANAQKDKNRIVKTFVLVPFLAITSSVLVLVLSKNTEYFILTKVFVTQIAYFLVLVPILKHR